MRRAWFYYFARSCQRRARIESASLLRDGRSHELSKPSKREARSKKHLRRFQKQASNARRKKLRSTRMLLTRSTLISKPPFSTYLSFWALSPSIPEVSVDFSSGFYFFSVARKLPNRMCDSWDFVLQGQCNNEGSYWNTLDDPPCQYECWLWNKPYDRFQNCCRKDYEPHFGMESRAV